MHITPSTGIPWSDKPFQLAQEKNIPVLVSIGYATCHWCHVMERESFEDAVLAAVLNESFVCIKVDREERPDVDSIYMQAIQALGTTGWLAAQCIFNTGWHPLLWRNLFPSRKTPQYSFFSRCITISHNHLGKWAGQGYQANQGTYRLHTAIFHTGENNC